MNWWKRNEADIYYGLATISFVMAILVMLIRGWPALESFSDNPFIFMVFLLILLGKVTDMGRR